VLIESEFQPDYSRYFLRVNDCLETAIDRIDLIRFDRHEVEELMLTKLFPLVCLSMEVHDEHIPMGVIRG
jgi:hypothetical protein